MTNALRRFISNAGRPAGPVDRVADQLDRVGRVVGVDADLGHHAAGDVGDPRADQVHLDVQAGHVGAGGDDGVEGGVRPAPAFLLADRGDQAALLQPGQHLGHRHLGHPGLLADLRTGQRRPGQQQVESGPVVQFPQQARRTRSALHRGPPPVPPGDIAVGSCISIRQRHYLIGKFPISFLGTAVSPLSLQRPPRGEGEPAVSTIKDHLTRAPPGSGQDSCSAAAVSGRRAAVAGSGSGSSSAAHRPPPRPA